MVFINFASVLLLPLGYEFMTIADVLANYVLVSEQFASLDFGRQPKWYSCILVIWHLDTNITKIVSNEDLLFLNMIYFFKFRKAN